LKEQFRHCSVIDIQLAWIYILKLTHEKNIIDNMRYETKAFTDKAPCIWGNCTGGSATSTSIAAAQL